MCLFSLFENVENRGKVGKRKKHLLWTQVWYLKIPILHVCVYVYMYMCTHTYIICSCICHFSKILASS